LTIGRKRNGSSRTWNWIGSETKTKQLQNKNKNKTLSCDHFGLGLFDCNKKIITLIDVNCWFVDCNTSERCL
jgi:hypothetical protein